MTNSKGSEGIPVPHLRAWRKWLGLTQRAVAELADVDRMTIMHLERGARARMFVLRKIAESRLGVSLDELLHYPPEED